MNEFLSSTHYFENDDASKMDDSRAARLLGVALRRDRPIDRLIDRLSAEDGEVWLERGLRGYLTDPNAPPVDEVLLADSAPLEQLQELKDRAKTLYSENHRAGSHRATGATEPGAESPKTVALIGMAAYFLTVAVALVRHDRRICSRSRKELQPMLRSLLEAMPSRWREMLKAAEERCGR